MTAPTATTGALDQRLRILLRGWPWLLSVGLGLYAGLPWLAPILQQRGFERAGTAIFNLYTLFCHQLPERSFFVGAHQVGYCHRCTALYTGLFVMSLLYALVRWKQPISTRLLLLTTLPIVIDGLWHMLNDILPMLALRSAESSVGSLNFTLRMITGVLCAIGAVLWAYPRINRELQEI